MLIKSTLSFKKPSTWYAIDGHLVERSGMKIVSALNSWEGLWEKIMEEERAIACNSIEVLKQIKGS